MKECDALRGKKASENLARLTWGRKKKPKRKATMVVFQGETGETVNTPNGIKRGVFGTKEKPIISRL